MYQVSKRNFSASNIRSICILANSRQADLIGSKIIQNIKTVSGGQVDFFGYGGHWMQEEGFRNTFDVDIDKLPSKEFHTYRKTKVLNESIYFRWNPLNLVNKHYVRKTDDQYELVSFSCELTNCLSWCNKNCQKLYTRSDRAWFWTSIMSTWLSCWASRSNNFTETALCLAQAATITTGSWETCASGRRSMLTICTTLCL